MSLDGFLTFMGLMIATYAILSPVSRLRLRLNMFRQLALGTVAITLVAFFEFFFELEALASGNFDQVFSYFDFSRQPAGFSNQEAAFLVVIVWMLLALLLHVRAKPRAISLGNLKTLSERLYDEGRYLELVELVAPYLGTIRKAVEKGLFSQRLHHRMLDMHLKATNPFFGIHDEGNPLVPKCLASRMRPLARLVPARRKAHQSAQEIDDLILQSDGVRKLLVRLKPEFAMALMNRSGWKNDEFRTRFFRDALNDKASHFYKELMATQNTAGNIGYAIDSKSVLLAGFFDDASVGAKYGIWKPVGDEATRMIRSDQEYGKLLNAPCPIDEDLWADPVFNTIHFFDIMVTCAARQGISDHMWLMYMSVLVRALEAVHNVTDDRVNLDDEFPTLGNRLIYEATFCLRKWVQIVRDLPADSPHKDARALQGVGDVSIPYWAAKDCINAMRCVLRSERLTESFITGLLESYMRDVGALSKDAPISHLRKMMVDEFLLGDLNYGGDDLRVDVKKYIGGVDHVVRFDVPEFEAALK
ncbi:hypothetical protein [Aliiroseovarius sp.]|uniref:hypothetical protein n=1 Tax=Aliiroseovarius sp. TaxID=1872442 RepID=UPI003BAD8D1A